MQRTILAAPSCCGDLASVRHGIAALSYERTRVQMEQHKFRHCARDERHTAWEQELKEINCRRSDLIRQQADIVKQSQKCGVGFGGGLIL